MTIVFFVHSIAPFDVARACPEHDSHWAASGGDDRTMPGGGLVPIRPAVRGDSSGAPLLSDRWPGIEALFEPAGRAAGGVAHDAQRQDRRVLTTVADR